MSFAEFAPSDNTRSRPPGRIRVRNSDDRKYQITLPSRSVANGRLPAAGGRDTVNQHRLRYVGCRRHEARQRRSEGNRHREARNETGSRSLASHRFRFRLPLACGSRNPRAFRQHKRCCWRNRGRARMVCGPYLRRPGVASATRNRLPAGHGGALNRAISGFAVGSHCRRRILDSRHGPEGQIAFRGFLRLVVPHSNPDRGIVLIKRRPPDKIALLAEVANDVCGSGSNADAVSKHQHPRRGVIDAWNQSDHSSTGCGEGRLGSRRTVIFALAPQDEGNSEKRDQQSGHGKLVCHSSARGTMRPTGEAAVKADRTARLRNQKVIVALDETGGKARRWKPR